MDKNKNGCQTLKILLCVLPFFKPQFILQFTFIDNLYNIAQIIIAIVVLILTVKQHRLSKTLLYLVLPLTALLISSLINNIDFLSVLKNIAQTFSFCLIINYFTRENIKELYKSLVIALAMLVFLDLIFILMIPEGIRIGLYNTWFLGAKNSHIVFILPMITVTYIYSFILTNKTFFKKILLISLVAASFFIIFSIQSATSIVSIMLFFVLLFSSNKKIYQKFKLRWFNVIYLLLVFLIVGLQAQNIFTPLIEDILGKDVTFTGRTEIWADTLNFIREKPLLGFGMEPSQIRTTKLRDISALNSHNMILEIFYQGGILLFFLILIFWLRLTKKIDKYSEKYKNTILKSVIIVYCIEFITEVFAWELSLWVFILLELTAEHLYNKNLEQGAKVKYVSQ